MRRRFDAVFLIIFLSLILWVSPQNRVFASKTDGTIDLVNKIAEGLLPEIGRINFGTLMGHVHVTDSKLTGYAWGENIGWINLAPSHEGVLNDAEGHLSGYAWGERVGWINFKPTYAGVVPVTIDSNGIFSGFAWGQNIGWISFNCSNDNSCGTNDFNVATDWRPASTRTTVPTCVPPQVLNIVTNTCVTPPSSGGCIRNCNPPVNPPIIPPVTPPGIPPVVPPINPPYVPPGIPPVVPPTPPGGDGGGGCVSVFGIIGCGWKDDIHKTGNIISSTTASVQNILKSPGGNFGTKAISTVGVIAAGTAVLTTGVLFADPLSFGEFFLIPFRLWALLMSLLGLKKRYRPWGTVYDSVTKQPLDPAYVVLKNEQGKEIANSITDLDGRYGFFVQKGIYYLEATKTHYLFPSKKMFGKNHDDLYTDLYLGEKIEVLEDGAVIYKNIPMDNEMFDWNEFEKKRIGVMRFNARNERLFKHISNWVFRIGFAVALIALLVAPEPYNYLIGGLYLFILIMRWLGIRPKINGSIVDRMSGYPLSFAIVSIYSVALDRELFKKVADQYGRYYALVPKGEYMVKISRKNSDESYTDVYRGTYNAKQGVINYQIKV